MPGVVRSLAPHKAAVVRSRPNGRGEDQDEIGASPAVQNRYQGGIVTYCGVFGEEAFTNALAERIATQAKLAVTPLPTRVHLLRRGAYRILLNYTTGIVDAPALDLPVDDPHLAEEPQRRLRHHVHLVGVAIDPAAARHLDHGAGALTRCSARLDSSCSARLLENLLRFPESLVKGRG